MSEALDSRDGRRINNELLAQMAPPTWRWYLLAFGLGVVVAFGLYAFTVQVTSGMYVTGLDRPVMWGFYIINFVFWVGLSHSGTMVSAILRLTYAGWRRPILRAAEAMTVFTITVAGLFPLIHLGRNWVFYYLIPYPNQRQLWPNFRSALLWDMTAITTYIIGSSLFLYLGMLPDLAIARDRARGWRRRLYALLAMGWRGTALEWQIFKKASTLMAVLIIPVAVSVHSIVAWDFAVTIVPGWHSTIFPPYFVVGAILSGVAAVVTLMIILRRVFHLRDYLSLVHLDNMAKLLLVISLLWSYFYFAEVFTTWYGHQPIEWEVFGYSAAHFAPLLLLMLFCNSLLPIVGLSFLRVRRSPAVLLVISLLVNVGMFTERFLIIVPSLSHKNIPYAWGSYSPSWVEVSITAAAFALFALLYTLFAKLFPLVAVSDVREGVMLEGERSFGRARLASRIEED